MRRSVFWLLDQYAETGESLAAVQATALEQAQLADQLGYSGLWLAEHHFQTVGTVPNPAVMLAAMAQRTTHLRLGPAVAVLPLRDPILIAEDYALVDQLSGGRLNMGVGTGSRPLEFAGLGVDFEIRRALFDKHLQVLRTRWSASAAGEQGEAALDVAPLQSPAPPIYVATLSEEGAYAIGMAGDSMLTLISPLTAELGEIAARLEAHSRGLGDGEHLPGSAEAVVCVFAAVADSQQQAQETIAPALGRLLSAISGTAVGTLGPYELMRERGTGLFGTSKRVLRQLETLKSLGCEHVAFVTRFGGMTPAAAERTLRQLAPSA